MIYLGSMTKQLHQIPFDPAERPDPMETSFTELETRVGGVLDELWRYRDQWTPHATHLHPVWSASLRVTAMYLNMCDAFHGCGRDFMTEAASGDESTFIQKHEDSGLSTELGRASRLLARTVRMLRLLGFKSCVVAIGGDALYYGMCEETKEVMAKLRQA